MSATHNPSGKTLAVTQAHVQWILDSMMKPSPGHPNVYFTTLWVGDFRAHAVRFAPNEIASLFGSYPSGTLAWVPLTKAMSRRLLNGMQVLDFAPAIDCIQDTSVERMDEHRRVERVAAEPEVGCSAHYECENCGVTWAADTVRSYNEKQGAW